MKRSWIVAFGGVCLVAVLGLTANCSAGSKVSVGRNWPAGELVSIDQIDHSTWNALIKKYVDPNGFVNYRAWKASQADQQALDTYLASLSRAAPRGRADKAATLAFWINAYNAVTVKGILREYPTTSIRNHTAKAFGYNIWDDLLLVVGGQKYSLNQMEHEVLRKMGEPRIHFAIVCASGGCPRLLAEAYVPNRLDEQLTLNTRQFFSDQSKFAYDAQSGRLHLSPILKWFAEDFGSSTAERTAWIAPYLPDAAAQQLASSGSASVTYLDYDWKLNDQARLNNTARRP